MIKITTHLHDLRFLLCSCLVSKFKRQTVQHNGFIQIFTENDSLLRVNCISNYHKPIIVTFKSSEKKVDGLMFYSRVFSKAKKGKKKKKEKKLQHFQKFLMR